MHVKLEIISFLFQLCEEISCSNDGDGNAGVLKEVRRVAGENADFNPKSDPDICSRLFTTCYFLLLVSTIQSHALVLPDLRRPSAADILR